MHDQFLIVVSKINLSLGSISTWYKSHCRLFSLLQNCFSSSTSVTGSLLLTAGTRFLAMDQSQKTILTPFNLFEWKAEMEILLRAKGLYRVTMATEAEPNAAVEKIKWHNRRDEAYGLLCLSIQILPFPS